jgi:hypothetical protein
MRSLNDEELTKISGGEVAGPGTPANQTQNPNDTTNPNDNPGGGNAFGRTPNPNDNGSFPPPNNPG